jgi:hypothetical protein
VVRHGALIVVEWRVIAEEMSIVITCNPREGEFMGFFWKEQQGFGSTKCLDLGVSAVCWSIDRTKKKKDQSAKKKK